MKKRILVIGMALLIAMTSGCQNKFNEVKLEKQGATISESVDNQNTLRKEISNENHYPVTVTNYNYNQEYVDFTIKEHPQRVVVTSATTLEIMLQLGLGEFIVGTNETKSILPKYKDEYEKLNHIKDTYVKENILEVQPDFIIGWYSAFDSEKIGPVDYWIDRGVNTFIQRNTGGEVTRNVDNIYWDILDIGKIFNCEERAEKLVAELKAEHHRLSLEISNYNKTSFDTYKSKPGVAVIEVAKEGEYRLYGQKALAHDMLVKLGIKDVTNGYGYSDEHLIERNPDVLLVHFMI